MNKYIQTLSRKAILITLLRLIKAVLIKLKSVVLSPLSKHVARKVQEAEELMEQEEWEEAAQKWQELTIRPRLKQVPAAAWTKGGRAYRYQLLFAEADEILSRGINIYPENIGLKMEFAEVAVDRQDWQEVVKRWQEVIDASIEAVPSNVWAKLIRALRYDSVAKQKQAESVAEQNLETHQNSPTIATEFAYAAVDKQDWPEAARRWRYVVSIYEEDTPISVWINLSKSLRFSSQQDEAEEVIRNATELYPEAIELRLELAEVLISQQKWSEALSVIEAVLKDVEPYSPDFESLGQYRMAASVLKRLIDIDSYKQKVESYKQAVATRDGNLPKIAIYTAISRNYDSLKLPEVLDARFDYIVFSDTPIVDTGVFKVRPMPYLHQDPTRSARFIKTHPHLLLEDYDLAIWIDANIMILDDIYPIINEFIASRKPLAAIEHPLRQSVYEEADACIDINKDKADIIREQIDYYEDLGLPGQDLIESNFMVFDLKNKKLPDMFNTWWSQIDIFSKRDQLSFPFVINKHSIKYHHLTKRPSSIRDHPSFALIPHAANNVPNKLVELLSESQINPYNDQSFSAVKESRVSHQKDRRIDVVVCVHNALDDV
ncbi:MAG: glycosyltransferase domain-containing protein, partial [Candidatus Saccharimonadales bacterium]